MNELIDRYSKYGITADLLNRLLMQGMKEYGYSEAQSLLLLRYTLGLTFQEPESFTLTEVSMITGESRNKVLDHIEAMITPIIETPINRKSS